ncbi:hypothetical protein BaRGS_00036202 [Batillaria attramentaria]|uniref:Uncharacterized protein n=1 Tax=Batillaria attramentaria TaxID=370345 RepID=A0ABD0JCF9_9CAEN
MEDAQLPLLLSVERSFSPPHECGDGRCQDLFPEFLYIVVTPAAVVVFFLLVIFFSLIICCSVKRVRKSRAAAESEDQLASFEAVRRASASVRRMSHNNSTPLLGSRSGSMSLVREHRHRRGFRPRDSCHSAPGTLQRPDIPLQEFPLEERRQERHQRQRPYSAANGYTTH